MFDVMTMAARWWLDSKVKGSHNQQQQANNRLSMFKLLNIIKWAMQTILL